MFGRIAARLLLAALRSPATKAAATEVTVYVGRRATAYLMRKLRGVGKSFND